MKLHNRKFILLLLDHAYPAKICTSQWQSRQHWFKLNLNLVFFVWTKLAIFCSLLWPLGQPLASWNERIFRSTSFRRRSSCLLFQTLWVQRLDLIKWTDIVRRTTKKSHRSSLIDKLDTITSGYHSGDAISRYDRIIRLRSHAVTGQCPASPCELNLTPAPLRHHTVTVSWSSNNLNWQTISIFERYLTNCQTNSRAFE